MGIEKKKSKIQNTKGLYFCIHSGKMDHMKINQKKKKYLWICWLLLSFPKYWMMSVYKNELLHFRGKFSEHDVFLIDISLCGKKFSVHFGMSHISSLWNFIWSQLPSAPDLIQWQRMRWASALQLKQAHFISLTVPLSFIDQLKFTEKCV